jgi:hypothetical protein
LYNIRVAQRGRPRKSLPVSQALGGQERASWAIGQKFVRFLTNLAGWGLHKVLDFELGVRKSDLDNEWCGGIRCDKLGIVIIVSRPFFS